ncbi:5-dehydro-4-deoxyglucarate dehydratase [Rathayibacter sp. PhB152]|uniref:5-dehydro-4-deoxyglucarate dehydratase n=1 Tax=Rathayibacter sp. PhB152 TaxID=2485190 RepID=UPI000F4C1A8F|nr:5-dehydro-4-deoxyglucarate dehydratase [Rathayibacter sp. PhB152]ROQ64157.1 5-dehydro-4-deoxyglucarate dehydratase [Rathayibacter sp. PhB152]
MTLPFRDGPLYFPVTAFDAEGEVDLDATAQVLARGLEHGPGGVFPACGTGEFHALSSAESLAVARASVEVVAGRVPVVAGVGGPIGQAVASARALEKAGVDGLLLLPPYLVGATQEGLGRYVGAVAGASSLPVVVYHRGSAVFSAATFARLVAEHSTIAGFKDGVGDVALAQEIVLAARAVRDDLQFFNGLLTAEASQVAYRALGIPLYSSAVFAMAPAIANAFYRAYTAGDQAECDRLLTGFYHPLVRLRDTTPGYAVALIKAGLRLSGAAVGGVRPPLTDPGEEHLARLHELLRAGEELVAA